MLGIGKKRATPVIPEGLRVYAVGDIHGRVDLLRDLHHLIRQDAVQAPESQKLAIYIGDYIDRGLHSNEVIDIILGDPLPEFDSIYLKGNHEAALLEFLTNPSSGMGWLEVGGKAALLSYGVGMAPEMSLEKRLEDARDQLVERMPGSHIDFLKSLPLFHEEGDYFFTHAGIKPGIALDRQKEQDLLWIREDFTSSRVNHGKVVVHGHTVTWQPENHRNRIGIDTGAFASGVLTCLVLSGSNREFIQTRR